jgi:hypothetical protein
MATYKVLQDIEAEDKLVGPLSLRQCIYAAIAILAGYLSFIVIKKGFPYVAVVFFPFLVFGVFFAIPWSKQQSTEVWALAKIRFALKPRRRIWDQSGVKNLVTVTAPRQLNTGPTIRDMSENEVRSRLQALADTIDSRGWAVKNVNVNMNAQPYSFAPQSDRLVDPSSMPQPVSDAPTTASDDMFDLSNNPIAQQFEEKISASTAAHRQQAISTLNNPAQAAVPAATNWYLPQQTAGGAPATAPTQEVLQQAQEIRAQQTLLPTPHVSSHLRTIQPLSVQQAQAAQQAAVAPAAPAPAPVPTTTAVTTTAAPIAQPPVTEAPNPAILELANNNDLNVATIAREAQHRNPDASGEVVVKLH